MLIRRIARPMLASIFVLAGVDALRNPTHKAEKARPFIDDSIAKLPDSAAQSLPSDTETLVRINGAIQLVGGSLLATGTFPRAAALALSGSLIPTTLAGHDFWNESDPTTRSTQRIQFLKNVGLLGGLLIAAVDTEGKPSIAWRGRRATRSATAAVAAAVPLAGHHGSPVHNIADIGSAIGAHSDELRSAVVDHGSEVLDSARAHSGDFAETATERAAEFASIARERAPEFAESARKRGHFLRSRVAERAPDLLERARERGTEVAELGTQLADAARDRGTEFADMAREIGTELTETVKQRGSEVTNRRSILAKRAKPAADKYREH